ncbi:unnamed protein product [Closterium sp. NIES-53]
MQTSQKQYADRQRRDHSVAVGDQVLLDTRNLNLSHLPSKLRPRFCGPFLVEAHVTPVTFRLRLPDTWKLHNAFHVQLLKPYKDPNQQFQGRQLPPPPPVLIQDEPEYEVECVLTHRRRGGKTLEFLLRWKGYEPTEDSWVVEADMGNARRALKDYLVKQGAHVLLALAATKASTLHGCTSTSTTAAATSTTTTAAASTTSAAASTTSATAATTSTAATDAPTPGTTPTSTATSSSSTASPSAPSTTLAVATSPIRGKRSSDLLSAKEVDSSSKSNRGEKGDRGTPLKERGATVAARSTYS